MARKHVMTVNLTRIYTKLGDGGETHLGDMSRVPKTHPRIEAYGTLDELNAQLGVALATAGLPERIAGFLRRVQNDLFDVGADISVPHGGDRERLRVVPEQTTWLEHACDEVNAELAPLKSFLLPGGTPGRGAAARLPHGLPARRAPRGRLRRRAQPGVRPLPQPALRPALHPRPRGERRRRAALGARAATATERARGAITSAIASASPARHVGGGRRDVGRVVVGRVDRDAERVAEPLRLPVLDAVEDDVGALDRAVEREVRDRGAADAARG